MSTITQYLNLIKPQSSDNMNPNLFANNADILDAAINDLRQDYVVAVGVQDAWDYRRWASGLAECWIESYTTNMEMAYSYGDPSAKLYWGTIPSPGSYPFTFLSIPLVIPTFSSIGNASSGYYSFPIWAQPNGTKTTCPSFRGIDPTQGTLNGLQLAVYVKGRWK